MFKNRGVFQMNDTAVRAGFEVPFYQLTVFILMRSKIISYRLFLYVQIMCDSGYTSLRQRVLDPTQFFKCNVHIPESLVNNIISKAG